MKWIIIAYYCGHPIYADSSKRLIKSMNNFNIKYDVVELHNYGNWYSNMQMKPVFIKQMLEKHDCSLVYVDIDAEFLKYPSLFDTLVNKPINIAVHVLDHSKRRRNTHPPEMLSGTIFMNRNNKTISIVDEWITECHKDPKLWDQRALDTVLKNYGYYSLPEEYCTIFDYMADVKDPVIKHYQASRIAKRQ